MTEPRVPDGWLAAAADPEGEALERAMVGLVARMEGASSAAAAITGRPPLGLRAIELPTGDAHFLCAYDGPAFLCISPEMRAVTSRRVVQRHAAAGLLWEQLEGIVDPGRLAELAQAGGRLLAVGAEPEGAADAVQAVVQHALGLAAWRSSPLRAVASMTQVDVVSTLQDRAYRAYARFIGVTEPLVEQQDRLTVELVAALRAFEEAAARAGVGERLADRIGVMLPGCDDGAAEMADAHLTPLA